MPGSFPLAPDPSIQNSGSDCQYQLDYSDTDGSDDNIVPNSYRTHQKNERARPNARTAACYSNRLAIDKLQDKRMRRAASQRRYYQRYD